jgi:hypothetical protein
MIAGMIHLALEKQMKKKKRWKDKKSLKENILTQN